MSLQKWALVPAPSELLMLADHTLRRVLRIISSNSSTSHRKSYDVIYHKRCLSAQWFCGLTAHETKAPGTGQKTCKTEAAQEMCFYKHLTLPSTKISSSVKSQQGCFAQIFILSNIVISHQKFGSF